MSAYNFAPTYTRVTGTTSETTVLNGGSIKVWGIIANSGGVAGTVTLKNTAGDTISVIGLPGVGNAVEDIPFVADGGLTVTNSQTSISCTIFHSQVGG